MESILPGIYRLDFTFAVEGEERRIHPAIVETDAGVVLVDTGLPEQIDAIGGALETAGYGFDDVDLVALTHEDYDHAGALHAVVERSGATVLASRGSAPFVRGDEELLKTALGTYPPTAVDVELVEGVVLPTAAGPMEVVETPGHTPGHVSYYFPEQAFLLAGDALTAMDGLEGPAEAFAIDMDGAIGSVGRLAELDIEGTLCFHGGFVEHAPDRLAAIHDELRA